MGYGNTNRGQIWPNDRKGKDTQPDFKGSLNIKGEEFSVSAWKQKGGVDSKAPSISFSVQPKKKTMSQPAKDYVVLTNSQPGAWD